ncbi:25372_t:CDS:1, partial [Gigaspora rosea]
WKSKSTVDSYCNSKKYKTNKSNFEAQERAKKQIFIWDSLSVSDIKNEVIEDLIEIFAIANIPLEK